MGDKRTIFDFNPTKTPKEEQSLWLWGGEWIKHLEWDPKEWQWRRIGILAETNILNYSTKRGYRTALRQNNHQMPVDAEMEAAGVTSKARAKFFNRIWHPYLPRKVSAMQWLILTEGLPVGAWRERLGMSNQCQLCPARQRETLQHAFQECSEISRTWELFRAVRQSAGLPTSYHSWKDISRGLMTEPAGPKIEEDLRWDTAATVSVNMHTPWDVLRAQLLWSIWCRRVELAFRDDHFHLGAVLWHAWRNTIYCAMEAYRELLRQPRSEEKKQELISCFQKVWTQSNIFGRLHNGDLKWNITPPASFLPVELGAWNAIPIRIQRFSPSLDPEAEFVARQDFANLVDELIQDVASAWQPAEPHHPSAPNTDSPAQSPLSSPQGSQQTSPPTDTPETPPLQPFSAHVQRAQRAETDALHNALWNQKRPEADTWNDPQAVHQRQVLGECSVLQPPSSPPWLAPERTCGASKKKISLPAANSPARSSRADQKGDAPRTQSSLSHTLHSDPDLASPVTTA